MRRVTLIGACVLVLSLISWGQRGGGFRSGGFHGGGFHGGAAFASHGGMRSGGSTFASASHSSFHGGGGFHAPHPSGFSGDRDFDRHRHGFRFRSYYSYYPYWYGSYPYAYGWYGSPFWWNWESSYNDTRDTSRETYSDAQYQTAIEVNRLADEVEQLRAERASSQVPPPQPQPRTEAKVQEDLPVVLVFMDKRIREVKNYAVANETLIVLDDNRRTKFPLVDIDLAATMKLNDERGVEFQVPNPVMNQ